MGYEVVWVTTQATTQIRLKKKEGLKVHLIFYPLHCQRVITASRQKAGTSFPGDYSGLEPPESISNSEVKRTCANDSVRSPHAKVGHRQGFILKSGFLAAFFLFKMLQMLVGCIMA